MADEWRAPDKRQLIVRKIAETVQQYPDVLNRNPSEIEEAIYAKVSDKDSYMNMVGKVLLSIKQKGAQMLASRGGGGPGMMPFQPGMHHGEFHPHGGMHMRGGHPGMPPMGPGMGGGHPHHMMNGPQPGYPPRMPMHPGGQMIHGMGGGHPMMGGMGPHRGGVPPAMMYPGGAPGMMPPRGPVPRMQPQSIPRDGVQPVTALPNPSFSTASNIPDQHSGAGGMNQPMNLPASFPSNTMGSTPNNQQPMSSQSGGGIPHVPTSMNPPSTAPTQAPSPAPPKSVNAPSPRPPLPMPSPGTPWNPASPAHAPSPSHSTQPHPEANSAVLSKLQELQPYVPLLARMMDRIEKSNPGEKTRNEQWVKLNSLYNVIQSKNMKVPLPTLEKCHAALVSLFKNKDPNASAPSPAPPASVPAASSSTVPNTPPTHSGKAASSNNNPPSVKVPLSPVPKQPPAPVPPSPPALSPSRNLHDFMSLSSPRPHSFTLQPTFCPEEDPLDRLPPEKKAKLDDQANRSFILCLKREILRLRNFHIKEVQQQHNDIKDKDRSILLECNLVSDGLPSVPPIMVRVARDYPQTSPECLIPEYQSDSNTTDFNKKVGHALMNQLSRCEFNYTLSHVLGIWEGSVLEIVARELEDVIE